MNKFAKACFYWVPVLVFVIFGTQSQPQAQELAPDFTRIIDEEGEFSKQRVIEPNLYSFGRGLFFVSDDYNWETRLYAFVQNSWERRQATTPTSIYDRFRIRRAYINIQGRGRRERLRYRLRINLVEPALEGLQLAVDDPNAATNPQLNANNVFNPLLLDALVSYNFTERFRMTVGQRSTFSDNREVRIPSYATQFPERSPVTGAFSSLREFGLYLDGNFPGPNNSAFKPAIMVTTGDGQGAFLQNYGGLKYAARLDFLPNGTFSSLGEFYAHDLARETQPKAIFGFVYSINQGITSRRGRNSGRLRYFDAAGNTILPGDYEKGGFDLMMKHKGTTVFFEYAYANVFLPEDSVISSIVARTVNFDQSRSTTNPTAVVGVDAQGDAIRVPITYKQHIQNQLILGNGWQFSIGHLFKSNWTIDFRYAEINAAENSFLNNTLFYSRPRQFTIGTTGYLAGLGHQIKISWSYTILKPNARGGDGLALNSAGEYYTRVLWQFIF